MGLLKSLMRFSGAVAVGTLQTVGEITDEIEKDLTPKIDKLTNKLDAFSDEVLKQDAQKNNEPDNSSQRKTLIANEEEYLDMYREYAESGEITEKMRRRLDKFAAALGFSSNRQQEIEKTLS